MDKGLINGSKGKTGEEGDQNPQKSNKMNWRMATTLVHGGTVRSDYGETSEALFLTSGYVYETAESAQRRFSGDEEGFIYSRFGNPTVRMFEERMIELEGAEDARATATGMAAVTASLLCQLSAGDHVVSARALFGSCRYVIEELLPRFGIGVTLVDGVQADEWRKAIRLNTKVFFLETPTNPTLEIIDIESVADIAHENGVRLIVDNVFATPILQHPLSLGADVVVYSATKHIDGQGRCLGGIVLSSAEFIAEYLGNFLRQTGPSLSPFNAWVMLKGLETLDVRVREQCRRSHDIAIFLERSDKIQRVVYPGLEHHPQHNLACTQMAMSGNIISFYIKGGKESAFRFLNALSLISISNNLGDVKSLITHPETTTHQRLSEEARAELGIDSGLVRLCVGLEDTVDLIDDLEQALNRS
ncbi:MAG: O-succinylhomoserine sulfhydrylase [Parvularculales bacterium]